MRRLFAPTVLASSLLALALAGCDQPTTEPADAPAPVAAVLAGVDLNQPLRALGTEPFWSVEITPTGLIYSDPETPGRTAANPGPVVQGTTAVYSSALEGGETLVVTLAATECSDGMSDRTYPLTARVELGQTTLTGCANTQAALLAQPPA